MKLQSVLISTGLVAGCLAAVSVAAPASATPVARPSDDAPSYLFVVNSRRGRISGIGRDTGKQRLRVTFHGVSDHATQFADRPVRKSYVLSTRDLVDRWGGWFRGDPPNAVLSFVYPGGKRERPHSIVLELTRPRYHGNDHTLTFTARHQHRQSDLSPQARKRISLPHRRPPTKFDHGSLFIDSVTEGVTSACDPAPEVSCPDANLSGVDWSGRDLSYAELDGVNLRGANLAGANFRFADLSDVDLSGANLTNTTFADAHMRRATLTDATLKGTDLSRASLLSGLLPGADLTAANGIAMKGMLLNKSLLTGAHFAGNDLTGTLMKGARLAGADFTGATLNSVVLDGSDLGNVTMNRANLADASLVGTDMQQASLVGAAAATADFSRADMRQSVLTGANLSDSRAAGTNLTGANLDNVDATSAKMPDVNLAGASLRNVTAPRADLSRSDLTRADMTGMNLKYATITGSDLRFQTTWFTAEMPYDRMNYLNLAGTDFRDYQPPASSYYQLNLNFSNLSRTDWRGWDRTTLGFWGADLTDADLRGMKPRSYSMFVEAKFTRTKMSGSTFNKIWFTRAVFRNVDATNVHWDGGFLAQTRFIDTNLTGSSWVNKSAAVGDNGQSWAPVFEGSTVCPDATPIPCMSLLP